MRLQPIQAGDVVKCDVRGQVFFAEVEWVGDDGTLRIQPHARGVTYRHVKPRQVIDHWKHGTRRINRGAHVDEGQLELTGGACR